MPRYSTRQRDVLLGFLDEHAHESLTAKQIAEGLSDEKISLSAVYRNLSELDKAGKVRKVTQSGARDALYRYVAASSCHGLVHLSCKSCGRTFHLENEMTEQMVDHFKSSIHFTITPADTVIYGICQFCEKK